VRAAGLAGGACSVLEVAESLGDLQLDATRAVARSHLLVLWSRLGTYDQTELDGLLWNDRSLFEYRAFILPTRDAAIHAASMRAYPLGESTRARYVRSWLAANRRFQQYVLGELEARGPLRSRELEDRAELPWRTGGWNDGTKNTSRMLELLHAQGRVLVAGREGSERLWQLAERVLPALVEGEPITLEEAARRDLLIALRSQGVTEAKRFRRSAKSAWAHYGAQALDQLEADGEVEPVRVDELDGNWYAHPEALADSGWTERTTLLSPFDNLIRDRERAEQLFGFQYRLEIYVPKHKRRFGYWVMPVLKGGELVGRVDLLHDRTANELRVNATYPEPLRSLEIDEPLASLAEFVGADRVTSVGRA
jgi:uncharacterized protein YcaQ